MFDKLKLAGEFLCRVLAPCAMAILSVVFRGKFMVRCHDADGNLLWEEPFPNGTCTAGITDLWSVYFNSGTQKTTWYFGLVDNAGWSDFPASDTMASHGTWTENTDYDEAVRQTWTKNSPAAGAITTQTVASFTMNATKTLKGAFLTSVSTKGGTTGILWATGAFGSTRSVIATNVVTVSYSTSGV